MSKWSAHVVLVPGTSPAHATPSFDLAIRIAASRAAVKVTILAVEYLVPKVWGDPIYGRCAPRLPAAYPDIELVPVKDGIYDGTLETFLTVFTSESAEESLVAAFESKLGPLMACGSGAPAPPPCCIISDMLVGWTQLLAAKFNIPRHVIHIQSIVQHPTPCDTHPVDSSTSHAM